MIEVFLEVLVMFIMILGWVLNYRVVVIDRVVWGFLVVISVVFDFFSRLVVILVFLWLVRIVCVF